MARPIRFRTKKQFKVVNRCIMCGRSVSRGRAICTSCNLKRIDSLKKSIRARRR